MRRLSAILVCALASLVATGASAATPGAATLVSQGVVKWRFQVSGQYVLYPPAVGPDGGVVVASSTGDVYSLTAAGALRWVVSAVGSSGGPSIGADGTVYVASMSTITAIAADGSIRWSFTEPSSGQGVIAGPTVGPDGNIYVISDLGGLGAFALSPAGQLLWSNPGNPTFAENGQLGVEIVFGSGRLYAAFDERSVALSTMFGLSLGGAQQWARAIAGGDDPFMQQQRQPATGSDGSLYLTGMGGANGWSLNRVDPGSGDVLWNYSPYPSNGMSAPSVGPDGSVYFSRSLSYLESVTPAGQSRWTFTVPSSNGTPSPGETGGVQVSGQPIRPQAYHSDAVRPDLAGEHPREGLDHATRDPEASGCMEPLVTSGQAGGRCRERQDHAGSPVDHVAGCGGRGQEVRRGGNVDGCREVVARHLHQRRSLQIAADPDGIERDVDAARPGNVCRVRLDLVAVQRVDLGHLRLPAGSHDILGHGLEGGLAPSR
jgi:outer membrane protein assembly factor BamB